MRRRRNIRLITALGVAVAAIGATAGTSEAGRAEGGLDVRVAVRGPNAAAVADGLTFELFEETGGTDVAGAECGDPAQEPAADPLNRAFQVSCGSVPFGDYTVGIDGAPEGWNLSASCSPDLILERISNGTPSFTIDPEGRFWQCDINLFTPILAVDKTVSGGDATVADFPIEVYTDAGAQVDIGTVTDPDAAACTSLLTECLLVPLPSGLYQLGEVVLPEYGYDIGAAEVVCDSFINLETYFDQQPEERELIESESAAFRTDDGDAYCTLTNPYLEGQLIVTTEVTNDNGGTATATDVSIEVYDSSNTLVVTATACAADGSCLDTMLPVGDYQLGYIGPEGYTRDVVPATIAAELITDDPDAEFTIVPDDAVVLNVVIDDPEPPPTTVPPTTVPPTTAPPTTLATTTTAFDAGAATLPQTGTSARTNSLMTVMALAFIGSGLALLAVRRRTA